MRGFPVAAKDAPTRASQQTTSKTGLRRVFGGGPRGSVQCVQSATPRINSPITKRI